MRARRQIGRRNGRGHRDYAGGGKHKLVQDGPPTAEVVAIFDTTFEVRQSVTGGSQRAEKWNLSANAHAVRAKTKGRRKAGLS